MTIRLEVLRRASPPIAGSGSSSDPERARRLQSHVRLVQGVVRALSTSDSQLLSDDRPHRQVVEILPLHVQLAVEAKNKSKPDAPPKRPQPVPRPKPTPTNRNRNSTPAAGSQEPGPDDTSNHVVLTSTTGRRAEPRDTAACTCTMKASLDSTL
eukprot:1723230-Pleurochrysis_carterae.AAC.1